MAALTVEEVELFDAARDLATDPAKVKRADELARELATLRPVEARNAIGLDGAFDLRDLPVMAILALILGTEQKSSLRPHPARAQAAQRLVELGNEVDFYTPKVDYAYRSDFERDSLRAVLKFFGRELRFAEHLSEVLNADLAHVLDLTLAIDTSEIDPYGAVVVALDRVAQSAHLNTVDIWAAFLIEAWSNLAVLAWAISIEDEDEDEDGGDRRAVETLIDADLRETRRRLEGPNADLQRLLADGSIQVPANIEEALRTAIDTINIQMRRNSADRFTVERQIRIITEQLIELGQLARKSIVDLLTDYGAHPPEFVDELADTILGLVESMRLIGEPQTAPKDSAERLVAVEEKFDRILDVVEQNSPDDVGLTRQVLSLLGKGATQGIGVGFGKQVYDRALSDTALVEAIVSLLGKYGSAIVDLIESWTSIHP